MLKTIIKRIVLDEIFEIGSDLLDDSPEYEPYNMPEDPTPLDIAERPENIEDFISRINSRY